MQRKSCASAIGALAYSLRDADLLLRPDNFGSVA
jgi:hypothetical protein